MRTKVIDTQRAYENILVTKRGWVSHWPQKAVFIFSGGMDSTSTIARLLSEKKIELFPLFVNRGQTNLEYERKSVIFFNEFFKKEHPDLYHDYFELETDVPPSHIKESLKLYTKKHGHPLRNTILQMLGVQYAISLFSKKCEIKTVFCAQVPDDPFPHSTLTSLRANTVNVCENLGEWDWQVTSPNMDPLLSEDYGKTEMIRWCSKNNIPLDKTRSCYSEKPMHCGVCLTCTRRKEAFKIAKVEDKTSYEVQ
ncbi:7-cyano-7-deazaguanine synthase [Candidatus Woesebacteria bacterium]|nr:7-cyano-7-deazaguanine synthase [Candidatus Woesebacteria bacterium]